MLGEFDGVTDKIHQDLPDAEGIPKECGRKAGLNVAEDLQVFLISFNREHFNAVLDDITQVEFRIFQDQLFRLDLREIENIVDGIEQHVSR